MLTRKAFWLAIFSGLRIARQGPAQQLPLGQTAIAWRAGDALNNQCPVCGTMADAYIIANAGHYIPCSHPKPGQVCIAPVPGVVPGSRTVRCKRCNARFDQDGI